MYVGMGSKVTLIERMVLARTVKEAREIVMNAVEKLEAIEYALGRS